LAFDILNLKSSLILRQIKKIMSTILLSKQNGVAILTLNRPQVFNSFNAEMRQAMLTALDDCAADPSVRCVILTGEGKAFCAGQDLAEISDAATAPSFEAILDEGFNLISLKIRQLQKPVVAAVNGVAAGAGANVALACDIVVAAESAGFIQAFSKIGLIPDSGGTFTLPRLVGFARASALMMLGEKVSATEAERIGMIYRSFPDAVFEEKSRELAATLAAMPTRGLALAKQALNAALTNDFETQLALETQLQGQAAATADYTEGVTAFLEKRKPVFKGC
jgi:2-(1,2-epoxy-1,2-dihydrophenyl)acetyl-CoA isomerase